MNQNRSKTMEQTTAIVVIYYYTNMTYASIYPNVNYAIDAILEIFEQDHESEMESEKDLEDILKEEKEKLLELDIENQDIENGVIYIPLNQEILEIDHILIIEANNYNMLSKENT